MLATVVVVVIAVAVGIFLLILGRSAGPPPRTLTILGEAAKTQYSAEEEIKQTDLEQLLTAGGGTTGAIENKLFIDVNGDGKQEALVLVRGQGANPPLDVYLFAMKDGTAAEIFECRGVAQGAATLDGPQLMIAETICCPPQVLRTYYNWQSDTFVAVKTTAEPAGANGP